MNTRYGFLAMTAALLLAATAHGQILGGVMTVTGAEMHWWAGVACEATARLYDVDEDSVVFKKLQLTQRYDHGTITFRARKGMLIDLNKLHESIRATRLSGGTSSGLVSLEVDAKGRLVESDDQLLLEVDDSDAHFVLRKHPDEKYSAEFNKLRTSALGRAVKISGRIDNYKGRWPQVLRNPPENPRRILVSGFEILD